MAAQVQQGERWWLQDGDEECPHCGHGYHLETERRCAGCDAPSCAHCVGDANKLCPDCHPEPEP